MVFDCFDVRILSALLWIFLLLFHIIVFLAEVLDKLYDSLELVIIDTVLDLLVFGVGIELQEKGLKKLRNAVLYDFPLQDFEKKQLSNKFDV